MHPKMPRPSGSLGCQAGGLSGHTVIQAYRAFIEKQLQKVALRSGPCPSRMEFYGKLLKQDSCSSTPWVSLTHVPLQSVIVSHSHTLSRGLSKVQVQQRSSEQKRYKKQMGATI